MMGLMRRVLRLPEGNPSIPAGDPGSVQVWNPGPAYLRYRLLLFFVAGIPSLLALMAVLGGGALAAAFGMVDEGAPMIVAAIPAVFGLVVCVNVLLSMAFGVFRIRLEQDMLRYTLTDEALRLRRGVVGIEEITLSFANIQNVKLQQGFVQRLFGVADVLVETAGGGGAAAEGGGHVGLIVGVSEPEALRELIVTRARRFRGDGLRRPALPSAPPSPGRRSTLASSEAAALLREVVADLRAIRQARATSSQKIR